jgi:hypothetical protein
MWWFSGGAPARMGRIARAVRLLRRVRQRLVRLAGMTTVAGTALLGRAGPVVAQVTLDPDSGQGPGGAQLQQLVNWAAGMALIVCVGAMVFHAVRWGWGSQQHNLAKVQDGKEGVGRAALVGGVIAASAALVNFAVNLGGQVQ